MNNRYHERLCQISIHCYQEGVCMIVLGAIIAPFIVCLVKCVSVCVCLYLLYLIHINKVLVV